MDKSLEKAFPSLGSFRFKVLTQYVEGSTVPDIAANLGESTPKVRAAINSPAFRHALAEVAVNARVRERFTVEQAHDMFMNAHAEAESPSDQIAATRELVKLHRLDRDDKRKTVVIEGVEKVDVESMTDEELRQMALEGPQP